MDSYSPIHWMIVGALILAFYIGFVWLVGALTKWRLGRMALVGAIIGFGIKIVTLLGGEPRHAVVPAEMAGEFLGVTVGIALIMVIGGGIRNLCRRFGKREAV